METRRLRRLLVLLALAGTAQAQGPRLTVCTDYHCDELVQVQLPTKGWEAIADSLLDSATPLQERKRVRLAIGRMEALVGPLAGTASDYGENVKGRGLPGQLDCISESKNTTTYLTLFAEHGLLRWHDVAKRRMRKEFLVFYDHWTAVLRERRSGEEYAVDSWYLDNGQPAYIQPLGDWLKVRDFPPQ